MINWDNTTRCDYTVRYSYNDGSSEVGPYTATLYGGNSGIVTVPYSNAYLTKLEIKENTVGTYYTINLGTTNNFDIDCEQCVTDANVSHYSGTAPIYLDIDCN